MTTIEWTEETLNPIRARNHETGGVGHFCVHVSPGCKNCYAERLQPRYRNHVRFAAQDAHKVTVYLDEEVLRRPFRWRRGRRIFPCSMTDLFAEFVEMEWIDKLVAVAALTPQHTYQVLTKRADRMSAYWSDREVHRRVCVWIMVFAAEFRLDGAAAVDRLRSGLGNWWQGVSVEDQERANERIPALLKAKATRAFWIAWVSFEPLLGLIDLAEFPDWAVIGGESGQRARYTHLSHVRHLLVQLQHAKTPVFVKQLGSRPVAYSEIQEENVDLSRFRTFLKDTKGGDPSEWPVDLRVREYPAPHMPPADARAVAEAHDLGGSDFP